MPTYRLDLSYDGSGFRGFARQPRQRTIQGAVEEALSRALQTEVSTVGAGRTDAGVHARQQVMSFSVARALDVDYLLRSIQRQLAPEISPYSLLEVAADFDARHSARSRTYRYRIDNHLHPTPWARQAVWHHPDRLEIHPMNEAAQHIVGEHDFAAFCRAPSTGGTTRRVIEANWSEGDLVVFTAQANAFCHQMIRSLVGLFVDIGRGRRPVAAITEALDSKDRSRVGQLAPAQGLILWEVEYEA